MLKLGLTPNSRGNSSLYALSLILARILKGPAARDISLDFLNLEIALFSNAAILNHPVQVLLPYDLY
jgi:hypothetical protein